MRILGIDLGEKRIGLAVSDPLGLTAQAVTTLVRDDDEHILSELARVIEDKDVTEIVLGLPKNMDGSLGTQAEWASEFAECLRERFGLPVHLIDERLTSARAERVMLQADMSRAKRRKRIDVMAAQFILQAFLDRRGKQTPP